MAAMALMISPKELIAAVGSNKKIVIIGGGISGATFARYIRRFIPSENDLELVIIEPKKTYTTPFGTNEIITGSRTLEQLTVTYDALKSETKATIIHQKAIHLNSSEKYVETFDGVQHQYDYCIVATGIGFEYSDIEGLDATTNREVPHAYDTFNDGSEEQIEILKSQLNAMPDNGKVILVAPKNSYRCPPAPYERAGQIAQFIKDNKPNASIMILDPKPSFAKQDSFEEAWSRLYDYKGSNAKLSWRPNTTVASIELGTGKKRLLLDDGTTFNADVVTYIPTMKASEFAYEAGLVTTDNSFNASKRWCPINLKTFESTMSGKKGIYIIGDSSKTNLPKSGYVANSEAKACAVGVAATIKGLKIPESIITNGCFSVVGRDYAISIFNKYKLAEDKTTYNLMEQGRRTSPLGQTLEWHAKEFTMAHSWYENFVNDCYGSVH